jgi:hypothetical protein
LDINFGTGGTPAALATHFLQQQEKNHQEASKTHFKDLVI